MSNLNIWWQVPNGSTLKVWVDDQGSQILARARVLRSNDTEEVLQHDDLVPGPADVSIENDLTSVVRPAIVFQGANTELATIHAQVIDPQGNVIPDWAGNDRYDYNVQGKAGDNPARADLTVVNKNA